MKLVLDTNILVSAVINPNGNPRNLFDRWLNGELELATSLFQLDELARVLTYPRLQRYLRHNEAELLLARLREAATVVDDLPEINLSPGPDDNFILATAIAAEANALVTGDKRDLLSLEKVREVRIVTVAECIRQLESNF